MSLWVNIDQSTGTWQVALYKGGSSTSSPGYLIETTSSASSIYGKIATATATADSTSSSVTFDTWAYVVVVVDRSSNLLRFYKNGAEATPAIDTSTIGSIDATIAFQIARSTLPTDGLVDEVRVATGARTASWISTEHNNQNAPGSFVTVGSEEAVSSATKVIEARKLDYPTAGWGDPEAVDYTNAVGYARPSIGIDKDGNVHALYVDTTNSNLYYKKRSGSWGTRTLVSAYGDNPSLVVRMPNDATYGTDMGGVYYKTTTAETYHYYVTGIPEFTDMAIPAAGMLVLLLFTRRSLRRRKTPRTG